MKADKCIVRPGHSKRNILGRAMHSGDRLGAINATSSKSGSGTAGRANETRANDVVRVRMRITCVLEATRVLASHHSEKIGSSYKSSDW